MSTSARTEHAVPASRRAATVPRRQLGRHLRELRQGAGMSLAQVAALIDRGVGTVQRLETGTAGVVRSHDIDALCRVLGADDTTTEALHGLAGQGDAENWWHEYGDLIPEGFDVYIGLESCAHTLSSYQELVPGLLQTPRYAEALIRAGFADAPAADIARRVAMRMRRKNLLTRRGRPAIAEFVLDETALRRRVGGPKVMAEQLRHLADLSTLDTLSVRVLPYSAGVPLGDLTGPFTIIDFAPDSKGRRDPTVVYVENYTGDFYFERATTVTRYRSAHARLGRAALDAQASRDLLRRIAKEYEGGR